MRYIFLTLVFLLIGFTGKSQIKILKEEVFTHEATSQIDIKIVNNNILIPVDLGSGLRLYFLLDTGVKTTIITEPIIQNLIRIPLERKINVKGYGNEEPLPAWVSTKFNFKLNDDYTFENQDVIILENSINIDQFLGEPVYGIIGYDFLSKYQITLDYYREKMVIKDPSNARKLERLRKKKNVIVMDLDFYGSKPFIYLPVTNNKITDTLKLLLDTGFSGALSLYPNKITEQLLNAPYIDHYQGYGMNGLILSKFKKIESIQIDKNVKMQSVSTHFIDSLSLVNISHIQFSDGSIGNDILKRFKVSFDYENKKVYLKPVRSRINDPFYFNRAGIRLLYVDTEEGIKYIIQSVRKDSEAINAGIVKGDEIIAVNGKATKHLNLSRIYIMLNDTKNNKKEVLIKRDGEELLLSFTISEITEWN